MQIKIHNPNKLPMLDYRVAKPLQENLKDLHTAEHDKLLNILKTRGFKQPLNLWHKGDEFFLMDGHQRQRVMIKNDMNDNGVYDVPYFITEANTKKEAVEQLLEITSQYGKTTIEGLEELTAMYDLDLSELDVHFDAIDLDKFLDNLVDEDEADDEAPEVDEVNPPVSVLGQVYQLGAHRLMCGDARDFEAVKKLMDGAKANVVITSPPYASQRDYDKASLFDPIPADVYSVWYLPIAENIKNILTDDGSYFCNIKEHCDDGQRHLYVTDLLIDHVRHWGWRWVDTLCWRDTKNGVPGHFPNRFKDAWEPIYHYAKNSKIKFNPEANTSDTDNAFKYAKGNTSAGTNSGLLGSEKAGGFEKGQARSSNVLEIAAASTGDHSAVYPTELPAFLLRSFSKKGDSVYDPFMGSGTTMIAAEKLGRVSYGMELSPRYCDVIRKRYAKHIGSEDWEAVTPAVEVPVGTR